MLLVDGQRSTGELCEASPLDAALALEILAELASAGLVRAAAGAIAPEEPEQREATPGVWVNKPKARPRRIEPTATWVNPKRARTPQPDDPPGVRLPLLDLNPDALPADVLKETPHPLGEADPGIITGEATEYYLLSRIDGQTNIETLRAITDIPMRGLLQRLAKHHNAGTIRLSAEFAERYLTPEDPPPADLPETPETPETPGEGSDGATSESTVQALLTRMVDDPSIGGPLRRTGVSLNQAGMGSGQLGPKECLVLSMLTSETTLGELSASAPGVPRDLLLTLLGLYRQGAVRLTPPLRSGPPSWVTQVAGQAGDGDDVIELDYSTGQFDVGDFAAALEGRDEDSLDEDRIATEPLDLPFADLKEEVDGRTDSTREFWTLPPELFRGKDLPDYEQAWRAIPHQGDLTSVKPEQIFDFVVERRMTGILHVRRGTDFRNVWFAQGRPVHATSTETDDALGSLLWKAGELDKPSYLDLQRRCSGEPGKAEWQILQGMFVLVPDELQQARRRQVAHVMARLFHAQMGQYLFIGKARLQSDLQMFPVEPEDVRSLAPSLAPKSVSDQFVSPGPAPAPTPPASPAPAFPPPGAVPGTAPLTDPGVTAPEAPSETPVPLTLSVFAPPPDDLDTGNAPAPPPSTPPPPEREKRTPPKNLQQWIQDHYDLYLVIPEEALGDVGALRLGQKERRFLDAIGENRHRLRELLAMSSLGRIRTHQFLGALWAKHFLELVDEVDREDEAVRNLASLNKYLVRIEKGDLFNAVGCHPSATYKELTLNHRKEKGRFAPDRFGDREPEFLKAIDRVNLVLDRAYNALKDTARRRRYRVETYGEARLKTFADIQAKKAEVFLYLKQDYLTARDLYESAWDLVPNDPVFFAHLGYSHFRSHFTNKDERERGVQMVERALAMGENPRVYLVAAMLEHDRQNATRKQHFIDKARKLVPNREDFLKLLKSYRLSGE